MCQRRQKSVTESDFHGALKFIGIVKPSKADMPIAMSL